jgi:superfamily II DNA or RNA helicase
VQLKFDLDDPQSYAAFLRVKSLPKYKITGRTAEFPDEYASRLGVLPEPIPAMGDDYIPAPHLWDYQAGVAAMAIRKQKFAGFIQCGKGKTGILHEFARHTAKAIRPEQAVLIVSPLMVIKQTIAEAKRFYDDSLPIEQIKARDLADWLTSGTGKVGITNYEALDASVPQGRLGSLILDESSLLKSAYGKWGLECIRLGKGLRWKLALTGTPAPNDRIEYANHAVFLDAFPTVNSFLAKFFINRGQTDNRWELKPHALVPFYRALSHWSIFLDDPATYGWKDNVGGYPPVHVHIHDVDLTDEQKGLAFRDTGTLFAMDPGGITSRSVLSQIAKGNYKGKAVDSLKLPYIKSLVDSWPDESTIIWAIYNAEQDALAAAFPDAANIDGSTPPAKREELIADFQAGRRKVLISKGKVLGFGLNLQIATRHVFSGLVDSYELYHQCISRSYRQGATRDLNVHIPITEIERPMIETVLCKADRVQHDMAEQERIFRNAAG